jgi:hypothetical protein
MEDVLDHVPLDVSHASLTQALRAAQESALVRFTSMCLYKVLPIIAVRTGCPVDERVTEKLRSLEVEGESLAELLEPLRSVVERPQSDSVPDELDEACSMAAEMVLRAFVNNAEIREWADWCSSLVLDIHQEFDALLSSEGDESPIFYPAPEQPAMTDMEACELRDQVVALGLLRRGSAPEQLRSINESGYLRLASACSRMGATSENSC